MIQRRNLPAFFQDTGFNPLFQMFQREMDQMFGRPGEPGSADTDVARFGAMMPAMDVAEKDGAIEITAELPGVKEDEIEVSITDGVLTLKGQKSSDREEKEKDYHLVERRYGSFRRSVPLGFTPDQDAVKAEFKDGVLSLRIARPGDVAPRTQKIQIGKG